MNGPAARQRPRPMSGATPRTLEHGGGARGFLVRRGPSLSGDGETKVGSTRCCMAGLRLLGALVGAHAVYLMVLPSADPEHWREYTTDPKMLGYLRDEPRVRGFPARGLDLRDRRG